MLETLQANKDKQLIAVTVVLMGIGLLMVYTSSAGLGAAKGEGDLHHFFRNQAARALIAFAAMAFAMNLDYHRYEKFAPYVLLVSFAALASVLIPGVGREIRGSSRHIGQFPVQPSELAKFSVVLYLAVFLSKKGDIGSLKRGVIPSFVVILVAALLTLLQPSLGGAVAIILIGVAVVYAAGIRLRYVGALLGVGALAAVAAIFKNPYQLARILNFIGDGANYQVKQSLLALGTGGLIGKGPGGSMQKYLFLPDPHTDFVFAIFGEETGFVGALLLVSMFVFLLLRGLRIAANAPDRFGHILATGLVACVGVFFVLNIGVVTGLLPTTGQPLPFISYGGSALLINAVCVGVLLNISGHRSGETAPFAKTRWRKRL
ncbi:MAG: putative peptidoglycan glycosyltransferase FtsW [Candidatus Eisenbacteria bacterium]